MARKRHRRHSSKRRHHRVGAIHAGSAIKKVAGIAAGVFAGRLIATKLGATMNPKLTAAIPIVAGIFVPRFIKSDLGQGLGDGLIAVGTLGLLQQFNVVTGIGYITPGTAALNRTGHNMYNPATAKTVGAANRMGAPRPGLNRAVGTLNGIPKSTLTKLGALLEE